jgi:hypothetical protein
LEFRIFATSINPVKIVANIELCAALIEFCRATPAREEALTGAAFLRWFAKNKKAYPRLAVTFKG